MGYDVKLLNPKNHNYPLYLFDTSLWLKILKPPFEGLSKQEIKYQEFFESFKLSPKKPKILLTSLIISEIINRWLRDYGLNKYFEEHPEEHEMFLQRDAKYKREYFKIIYRPTKHYSDTYNSICEDLLAYESYCVCSHDEFGSELCLQEVLTFASPKLDFNDNYYVLLAKKKNVPIVTDDADFFVDGITVLTYNTKLHEKCKNAVIPIYKGNTIGDFLKSKIETKEKE